MKNIEFILPYKIKNMIEGMTYQVDDIGKSDSRVYIFDKMVLKIEKRNIRNDETIAVMKALEGKIPLPKVICYEFDENYHNEIAQCRQKWAVKYHNESVGDTDAEE